LTISLPAGEDHLQAELTRGQWLAAAESCYAAILQLVQRARPAGQSVELRVGARAQSLPGLMDRLQALGSCTVTALPEGAAALGALAQHAAIFRGAEPALMYRLPLPAMAVADEAGPRSGEGAAATHLLYAG